MCLINEMCQCFYASAISPQDTDNSCSDFNITGTSYQLKCFVAQIKTDNGTSCSYFCPTDAPINSLILNFSFIVPLIQGLSFVLVFLTMIEFICAQSPNAMKGILIGVWYFMLLFKFFLVNNLDINEELLTVNTWSVYHGAKGLGIFVSIVLFSITSRTYNYRQRNETVNEQFIIEEVYERELLLQHSE